MSPTEGVAGLGVLSAAFIAGLTGFGFNLLSVPILLLLYDVHRVVVMSLVLGLAVSGALLAAPATLRQVDVRLTSMLFGFSLLGLPLGGLLFVLVDPTTLTMTIGAITAVYAGLSLLLARVEVRLHQGVAAPAGVISGMLSTSTGLSGPPIVMFVHSQRLSPERFRATLAAYVFLVTLASIPVLWWGGFVSGSLVLETIPLLLPTAGGLAAGTWLFARLSRRGFDRLTLGVLVLMGLLNIVRPMV